MLNSLISAPPTAGAPAPSPGIPGQKRIDSRTLTNLNMDQVVDGYKMKDVVRAQRFARRWLMRKHFVNVVNNYRTSGDKDAEKLLHRNKALREVQTKTIPHIWNIYASLTDLHF